MSYAQRVYEIVVETPGINGGEIVRRMNAEGSDITVQRLNSVLAGLKRRTYDAIENRGSTGLSAQWYPLPDPEPADPPPYLDEAQRLLRDLKRIIPNQRAEWLAEQLQALIQIECDK